MAGDQGRDGALAAAVYFVELYDYALASGDVEAWRAVAGQTCQYCASTAEDIERVYGAGGRYVDGRVEEIRHAELVGEDLQLIAYAVEVELMVAPGSEYDIAGEIVQTFDGDTVSLVMEVAPSVRGWQILGARTREAEGT